MIRRGDRAWWTLLGLWAFLTAGCTKPLADQATCRLDGPPNAATVNVISYPSPGMQFFGDRMAACSGQGGVKVRHSMLPFQELVNQATFAISSATPSNYHLIHVYDAILVEWAAKGWLAPLDDLVKKYWDRYQLGQIPDSVWDLMKYNGHIYAIPAIQNVQILFYRKDLFTKYGIAVPRTYDDLENACHVLRDKGGVQYPLVALYGKQNNLAYEFHDLTHSLGGSWFTQDGKPKFNDAIGVAAFQRIATLYHSCVHPGVTDFSVEDAVVGLQQGQFVMGLLWMNEAPQMDDPAVSRFANQFDFAPAPAACTGCPAAAYWAQDSWVIPANTTVDRDLLFRIAMEGTSARAQAAAASLTLGVRAPSAEVAGNRYWGAGIQTIQQGATALPRRPYAYLASNAIERYGIQALLENAPPQRALDDAAREFSAGFAKAGFQSGPPSQAPP